MPSQKRRKTKRPIPSSSVTDGGPLAASRDLHLVTFRIGNERLAVSLEATAEIIRFPALAKMPLGPASLLGLANLRGTVVPVISMRRLLGFEEIPATATTRVIIVAGVVPLGFAVDRIENLVTLPSTALERGGAGSIKAGFVDGVIKGAEGADSTKLLNLARLLDQFSVGTNVHPRAGGAPSAAAAVRTTEPVKTVNQLSFVSFELDGQEYAVPLRDVREIIPLPDHVSEVARAEIAVLGVVTLRDRLLPIVSLRALLGLSETGEAAARGKVLVVSLGESQVGVVADRTREIIRVDPDTVDAAPALLTRGAGDAEITSVCRLDGGRRLVAILSPDRLFRSDVMARIIAEQGGSEVESDDEDQMAKAEEQFVVFRLGTQEYGMPVAVVDEIARMSGRLTKMPKSPAFVDGVINHRGHVVPVIDLRRRFDVASVAEIDRQRILVLSFAGGRTGFLVDEVSEVIRIGEASIQAAPQLSEEQMRLIGRVANLGQHDRMILLVEPRQLLDRVETDVLEKFERKQATVAVLPS